MEDTLIEKIRKISRQLAPNAEDLIEQRELKKAEKVELSCFKELFFMNQAFMKGRRNAIPEVQLMHEELVKLANVARSRKTSEAIDWELSEVKKIIQYQNIARDYEIK